MRRARPRMAGDRTALTRELLTLVGLVVLVDAAFIAVYYAAEVRTRSGSWRLGFTVAWTVVTLAVVLRSLGRIRVLRTRLRRSRGH